jgi:hypothetical protein
LQQAKVDATLRYEGLLSAIKNPGSITGDLFSKLEIATTNSEAFESNNQQYAVVDKNGMNISGQPLSKDLVMKLETISQLINKVEETQRDIALVTEDSGIWERFDGTGDHHFRHTAITRHPQIPRVVRVRDITTQQDPIGHKYEIVTRIIGAKLRKVGLE